MRNWPFLLLLALPAAAGEKAAYDSNGRIIALISDAGDVEVTSNLVAVQPTGKRVPLLTRREGAGAQRQGGALAWSAQFTLPDGGRGRAEWKSEEDDSAIRYSTTVAAQSALDIDAVELVLDLPRTTFANGKLTAGGTAVTLARAATPVLYRGETASLAFADPSGNIALDVAF